MKKILLASVILLTLTTACKKTTSNYECNTESPSKVAPDNEKAYLQTFLTANNITATEKNGMFYTLSQGAGSSPNVCNNVTIDYVGNFINGTTVGSQFDASGAGQPVSFKLNGLILAWQTVLPLVKTGGTVTMYCPPTLAYGATASSSIPANSYLKFIVSLRDVR